MFDAILVKDGFELVACRDCALVFVSNPPTNEERARLYSFEAGYHEDLSTETQAVQRHEHEAATNLSVLHRHASQGRLLDIGCSTGLFLKAARSAGWLGQGLEYSPDSARVATKTYGLDVRCGELSADSWPPESFDVVTLWDVIEHLPDPKGTIDILGQLVARGGLLVLKTPNAVGLYPLLSRRLARMLGFWGHAEPPGHLFQFAEPTLRRMVSEGGFEVIKVHHQRIPVTYSFGRPRDWLRSLKWALYCATFIPMVLLGPWLRAGDDMVLVARRTS